MSMLHELIEKYAIQEASIEKELDQARRDVEELEMRLQEVQVVRAALEAGTDGTPAPAPRSRPTAPATTSEAPAPARTRPAARPAPRKAAPARATHPARKGRRKAAASPTSIHEMGIVDAAIHLAKERDITEADAGEILTWFQDAGYKSRSGMPTRNSIYVSLNREFTEGEKRGRRRITRPERGKFVFHFDADDE